MHFTFILHSENSEDCSMDDSLCYIDTLLKVIRQLVNELNFPTFGVCFGAQAIARALFNGVNHLRNLNAEPEFGIVSIDFVNEQVRMNPIFKGIEQSFYTSSSHSDGFVLDSSDRVIHLLKSRHWPYQAYQIKDRLCYGLQFHPEMCLKTSEDIFKTVHVPILYDDNVKTLDMDIGKVIARNFCELVKNK